MNHDTAALTAAAQQVVADARRLGLTWTLQNATVVTASPIGLQMDGDIVTIAAISMIGPVGVGLRVYVIQVPPGGNFIVGYVGATKIPGLSGNWTAMTLLNGWTNAAPPNMSAKYRLVSSPPNTLQIAGIVNAGTLTNGTPLATMPTGFQPIGQIEVPVTTFPGAFGAGISPSLQLTTAGSLNVFGLAVGTTAIAFNSLIPLDSA